MGKGETIRMLAERFGTEAKSRLGEATISGPWDPALTPYERARQHLYLLGQTYGEGHPGSKEPLESLMERQSSGQMLTWIINWQGNPVGMANLEITPHGIGEMCRTVELPKGTVIGEGLIYNGEVKTSAAAYQRLSDALSHPEIVKKIWALEADLRTATEIILPSGKILEAGVKTQHINRALSPMLLSVPRFQVSPEHGHSHQEVFLQSRLYFEPELIDREEPVYTPAVLQSGRVTIGEIAEATYGQAFGFTPRIEDVPADAGRAAVCELKNTAGIHFSTIYVSGNIEPDHIREKIFDGLSQSRFVEVVVPNRPENIDLQNKLYGLGLIPLGVMPGGTFTLNGDKKTVPTTIHFGTARSADAAQMVEIGLARDYKDSLIETVTLRLREEWRKLTAL